MLLQGDDDDDVDDDDDDTTTVMVIMMMMMPMMEPLVQIMMKWYCFFQKMPSSLLCSAFVLLPLRLLRPLLLRPTRPDGGCKSTFTSEH